MVFAMNTYKDKNTEDKNTLQLAEKKLNSIKLSHENATTQKKKMTNLRDLYIELTQKMTLEGNLASTIYPGSKIYKKENNALIEQYHTCIIEMLSLIDQCK